MFNNSYNFISCLLQPLFCSAATAFRPRGAVKIDRDAPAELQFSPAKVITFFYISNYFTPIPLKKNAISYQFPIKARENPLYLQQKTTCE